MPLPCCLALLPIHSFRTSTIYPGRPGCLDLKMISTLTWIPREVASDKPSRYVLSEEAYQRAMSLTKDQVKLAKTVLQQQMENMDINNMTVAERDDLEKYDMDHYDSDNQKEQTDLEVDYKEAVLSRVEDLIDIESPENEMPDNDEEEDDESDLEDINLCPSDRLFVCGRTDDDVSYLDLYVFDEHDDDNLYVHHDVMLPSIPLCLQPIHQPLSPGQTDRNFVAVGTFDPSIEIWNMNILDAACPEAVLKGHKDAVMSLCWNPTSPQYLASGSADAKILIWDLNACEGSARMKLKPHGDKVQCVQWRPDNSHVLCSASYDKTISLSDIREPDKTSHKSILGLSADPESLKWNPFGCHEVFCSDETGAINIVDTRHPGSLLRSIEAHGRSCTTIDFHPLVSGILLSASTDRTIKIWDVDGSSACCLASREPEVGKVFTASFATDTPFLVACAGSRGIARVVRLSDVEGLPGLIKTRL